MLLSKLLPHFPGASRWSQLTNNLHPLLWSHNGHDNVSNHQRLYCLLNRFYWCRSWFHYCVVIMSAMASQIASLTMVYSTVYSGADQRKHQSCASLALERGIHRVLLCGSGLWPNGACPYNCDWMHRNKSIQQHDGDTGFVTLNAHNKTWNMRAVLSLHWRRNDHDGVSNHQPPGCLLNRFFRRRSKKTSKLRVSGLCVGNSSGPVNSPHKGPVTRKMFPFDDVIMFFVFYYGLAPAIQYIPRNMHTVLLCFALLWLCNRS